MISYYTLAGKLLASFRPDLPLPPWEGEVRGEEGVFLFSRPPARSRAAFGVNHPGQLVAQEEDVTFLDASRLPPGEGLPPLLEEWMTKGRLRGVNLSHPRWRDLIDPPPRPAKVRVHLLALGDVGGMLLTGLRLLGGDKIAAIGICDLSEKAAARWEREMNQVSLPGDYDAFPPVEVVAQEDLFACDVFIFAASKGIPPVGSGVRDVRMAQWEANAPIVAQYARQARRVGFSGLWASVSDPVDPLAAVAFQESNRGEDGRFDGQGLFPEQIQGFGLGVMNARAAYYAKKEGRFSSFLQEGRAFGPHGEDLVIANSVARYQDDLSRELTGLTVGANLEMRALGYKAYVAPALSSGALSLLALLGGQWHYSSVFLGGAYMGVRNRHTPAGGETELLPAMPPALFDRIAAAHNNLLALHG